MTVPRHWKTASPALKMLESMIAAIRQIPRGKVSSYGAVARAAGYDGYARQVGQTLTRVHGLPWHRVLGTGGVIKVPPDDAIEQRLRLQAEGVTFRGRKVNLALHEYKFPKKKRESSQRAKLRTIS